MAEKYPYAGLINTAQAGFHKEPRPATNDATDYIRPDFELSERVEVLEMTSNGWLKVTRDISGAQTTGYVDKKYVSKMPGGIARSAHRPGIGYDGVSLADDLKYGDETKDQITDISTLFYIQANAPDWSNFLDMRIMCNSLFSSGDLQTNINAMIDKFQANTGGRYSSDILNKHVRNHDSTKRFVAHIQEEFGKKMSETGGDATGLTPDSLKLIGNPHFNTPSDTWRGGLTIAINDVWAYDLDLMDYDRQGDNYSAKVKLTLYDHFGLDRPDVEKKYRYLAGFRAWYVLQHLKGYKPFIVDIPLEYSFSGKLQKKA
ncbi:MAG: DUF3289 family protein [Bacteroidia bacterium]